MPKITEFAALDARFELPDGAGSDAVHTDPQYGYAVTILKTDAGTEGTGINYTLGGGTDLVCHAINALAPMVLGYDVEELMGAFGEIQKGIADHHQLRWLGPHKGVTHAALASITNACFDLWAKQRNLPLWQLLLELDDNALLQLIDFSYLEDVLTREDAAKLLAEHRAGRADRMAIVESGYPAYDTSAGWFQYSEDRLRENVARAIDAGFTAVKLKVGSQNLEDDVRRAHVVRDAGGDVMTLMFDANQAWSLPRALEACAALADVNPFWIEEPTQPDDVLAHQTLAKAIKPAHIAVGEAVANRVLFKNFLLAEAVGVVQADCTRLAGVSEYLAVTLMAKQFPVKMIPHVGDMGQIHRHLVVFNHVALGHDAAFLEYIPHLQRYFQFPALVDGGRYVTPVDVGCSTTLTAQTIRDAKVIK